MYQPFSKVLIRTPLHSLKFVNDKLAQDNPGELFLEGLYLSSPEFLREYQKIDGVKNAEKLKESYYKYWIRSCMRCTPYGTFAGAGLINIETNAKNLILSDPKDYKRNIRLDMNYLSVLLQSLLTDEFSRGNMNLVPNNSLYDTIDEHRYVEYKVVDNARIYNLTSIQREDYIGDLLTFCGSKGVSFDELSNRLMLAQDVTAEEADEFITELIDAQVLSYQLDLNITGIDPLMQLIAELEAMKYDSVILDQLKLIAAKIQQDGKGFGFYENIERDLYSITKYHEVPKNTIQTDMYLRWIERSISREVIETIVDQVEDLFSLAKQAADSPLKRFKKAFYKKYENQEVLLSVALDADLGIGYGNVTDLHSDNDEFISDLVIGETNPRLKEYRFDYLQRYSFDKYSEYIKSGASSIQITNDELKSFSKENAKMNFAPSMYIMGSLYGPSGILDSSNFLFNLNIINGPSGGTLLGRFTQGNDEIYDFVKEVLAQEESQVKDALFAEIVHLPQARLGNVLLRPLLRKYEIPYVGKSGVGKEGEITVDDLMVSLVNDKIVLRSKRLNKQVIPRLTTAHNYSYNSLPVYNFLCDLQHEGLAVPAFWDWGVLENFDHLPRVTYKNIIIKKAVWLLEIKDVQHILGNQDSYIDFFNAYRLGRNIPGQVLISLGDNDLLIDFKVLDAITLLLSYLKKSERLQLTEVLFNEDNCIVRDPAGNPFTNELIIPIMRSNHTVQGINFNSKLLKTQRQFEINSEWLYLKIYSGSKSAEKILRQIILPFTTRGLEEGLFEKFFFIRYNDPSNHIRIRFYNGDLQKQESLSRIFLKFLNDSELNALISNITVERYSRELERYGDKFIEEAESIFFNDSVATLNLIHTLKGVDNQYRLLIALRGLITFMDDFNLNTSQKQLIAQMMSEGFFKEFGGKPLLTKQMNAIYRTLQKDIFSYMEPENDLQNSFIEVRMIFERRSESNASVINNIIAEIQLNELINFDQLIISYCHMFINRLYIGQQRKHELIIYHLLEKYLRSKMAIENKIKNKVAAAEQDERITR